MPQSFRQRGREEGESKLFVVLQMSDEDGVDIFFWIGTNEREIPVDLGRTGNCDQIHPNKFQGCRSGAPDFKN